ncbi:Pr6Pr family membrane protein [Thioclava sp. 15-R06ZXC-3]|uniref:Pr6Pr family membrane protein n=1 Tax=Thioclava arctica TaxID=3238301 RepID=A0ABV3TJ50_9RHOB
MTRISRSLALLIFLCEAIAFAASFSTNLAAHPHASVPLGILWLMVRYFTIWTNSLVGVLFGVMLWRKRLFSPALLAALTLWMIIVGAVYHLLLAGDEPLHGLDWLENFLYHTAVPILLPIWWLIFAPKRALQWRDAALWLIWPLIYLVYAEIRGLETGFYPYFFLNLTQLGWNGLAIWCAQFVIAFWIGGLVIIAVGRAMALLRLTR